MQEAQHISVVWTENYACAQPSYKLSDIHGQLVIPHHALVPLLPMIHRFTDSARDCLHQWISF